MLACACACVPEAPPGTDDTSESTTGQPECQTDADCPSICVDGHCVECVTDADCLNPKPICVGEVCQGCSLPGDCPDSAPICETDSCIPCSDDVQCQEIGDDICVSLELYADTKPGNVDMALVDDGNVVVAESKTGSGLDVIHASVLAGGDLRVRVSLQSDPAGAPFKLSYRTLLR